MIAAISKTNSALITNVNKPSVSIVIGKVIRTRIGLTTAFKTPKTTATTTAVEKLSTVTPGNIFDAIITAIVLTRTLIKSDILDIA